jgi:hypothetical protein
MKIFFVFLCFIFISSHAVYGGPRTSESDHSLGKSCCDWGDYRCCCKMHHGGIGKFHSFSSDFRNDRLCVDEGGCYYGWKC